MTENYYELTNTNGLFFEFESISPHQRIKKIIAYTLLQQDSDIYNLALGDILETGEVSDLSVSNNSDMVKVIATVVKSLFLFFEKYPNSFVFFKGSTPERTRLYRIIISRELNQAQKKFVIYGEINSEIEYFRPNQDYTSFIISLKLTDEN